jgi:hypothetical protein
VTTVLAAKQLVSPVIPSCTEGTGVSGNSNDSSALSSMGTGSAALVGGLWWYSNRGLLRGKSLSFCHRKYVCITRSESGTEG